MSGFPQSSAADIGLGVASGIFLAGLICYGFFLALIPVSKGHRAEFKNAAAFLFLLLIAKTIALLFFPYVEIVIHDLQSQTVAYIANNLSKRELGDESALEEMDHSAESGTIGPYEKINWDGRRMRCVSTVLFGVFGPMGASAVVVRLRHLHTVFAFRP